MEDNCAIEYDDCMVLVTRFMTAESKHEYNHMPLNTVYNVVTEPVNDSLDELTALEFFRACVNNENLPTRLTVRHLGEFLRFAGDEKSDLIRHLHTVLRETDSVERYSMIQFIVEGRLFNEEIVRLGVPTGRSSYEDITIDELFIDSLTQESATQYVASK